MLVKAARAVKAGLVKVNLEFAAHLAGDCRLAV
jgi:hypothetical protein